MKMLPEQDARALTCSSLPGLLLLSLAGWCPMALRAGEPAAPVAVIPAVV